MTEYMKLYLLVRQNIMDGVYAYGEKVPSKRRMAEKSGASVITVEHAYNLLMEEGYIEARERSGYYVIYQKGASFGGAIPSKTKRFTIGTAETENREKVERHLFPFSVFAKVMREVLTDFGEKIMSPSPNQGLFELREALSSYLARSRNMMVSPFQIWIGSGAEYLYGLNLQVLGRDRLYALEDPSYEKIRKVYEANGASIDFLPMKKDGIASEALEETKATVLHVTPVNSYPSGVTASASKRNEYVDWARERGGLIIEDDFDSEFTILSKPEDTLFSLDQGGHVIYMNSFSKTIAPSMRMAYVVLPPKLVSLYEKKVGFYSCTVPVFEQLVLAKFISQGHFERHINRVRRYRRRR